MKISNWHTSGRTNKTKDIDSTIFTVSGNAYFTLRPVKIAIRTTEEKKVSTVTKHKTALKFCDLTMTLEEAKDLQLKLSQAIEQVKNQEIEMSNQIKERLKGR